MNRSEVKSCRVIPFRAECLQYFSKRELINLKISDVVLAKYKPIIEEEIERRGNGNFRDSINDFKEGSHVG